MVVNYENYSTFECYVVGFRQNLLTFRRNVKVNLFTVK